MQKPRWLRGHRSGLQSFSLSRFVCCLLYPFPLGTLLPLAVIRNLVRTHTASRVGVRLLSMCVFAVA